MTTQTNDFELVREFRAAWAEPKHTRIIHPAIDVNSVLRERYRTSRPLTFTRAMLWDLERKKAASPGTYIPFVVRPGSDRSWPRAGVHEGREVLERHSQQRLWPQPDDYGLILERAELDHERQVVTFTGQPALRDPEGRELHATTMQPLFHVEHAVGGTEDTPENLWRVVHPTQAEDPKLVELFTSMGESPWLPQFIEIYIRRDQHIDLARR